VTQEEIARALGVSRPAVTRYEAGARTPRGALLADYKDLLDRLAAAAFEVRP
jgi:transcriptional regulator with XRE-family HTH domain